MTRYLALSGGVGGAKLALGLMHALEPENLAIVANTGDDFEHLGLAICPDIDTLTYTLSGLSNTELGWGRAGETWTFMAALKQLGGETWFNLGDGDLAIHVERTRRLNAGDSLTQITDDFRARLGIGPRILPMSDDPVRTVIETPDGPIAFQHYFVRDRAEPPVTGFRFDGAPLARPNPLLLDNLIDPALAAIIVCPSNPFISIDPILAVPGIRGALVDCPAPVIAVSPIVGGKAVKGPTAKMMRELGLPTDAVAVARHYGDLLDGFMLDNTDEALAGQVRDLGLAVHVTNTVMQSLDDRIALATQVLEFSRVFRRS